MPTRIPHWVFVCATLVCAPLMVAAPVGTGRMLQQLETGDWIQRAEALHYLGKYRVPDAVEPARALLIDDKSTPWIRGRALVALATIEAGVEPGEFGKLVAHDLPELRAAAAEVLELHGGNSAETWITILLKDQDPTVRHQAAAAYARRLKAGAWPVVDPLTRDLDPKQARLAARALAWVGNEDAHQRLAALLAHNDHLSKGLRGISDIPNAALIPILLEVLAGLAEEDTLRYGAVLTALQNHEWKSVIAGLAIFLQSGNETNVRTGARVMTVLTRSPELGEPLRAALAKASDVETIKAGLIALGSSVMEPDQHHQLFSSYLGHEDPSVRALAIRCLAHCQNINLSDALKPSLDDQEPVVVQAALGALKRAPVRNAPRGRLVHYLQSPLSSPDEVIRSLAYDLLGHAGSTADFRPAMAALAELLRGKDDELRAAAAKALGAIAPLDLIGEVVQAQGYLAKWRVIGTFLNDEKNSAFDQVFPPEEKVDFEATYLAKYVWVVEGHRNAADKPIEREVSWTEGIVDQTDGRLILSAHLPPPGSLAVGYAVADITVEKECDVILNIDGDDAFRVWFNDEKIAEQVAPYKGRSPCVAIQSDIMLKLKEGPNRFFVKTANIDHHWWVRLRLTDSAGSPIEFRAP